MNAPSPCKTLRNGLRIAALNNVVAERFIERLKLLNMPRTCRQRKSQRGCQLIVHKAAAKRYLYSCCLLFSCQPRTYSNLHCSSKTSVSPPSQHAPMLPHQCTPQQPADAGHPGSRRPCQGHEQGVPSMRLTGNKPLCRYQCLSVCCHAFPPAAGDHATYGHGRVPTMGITNHET